MANEDNLVEGAQEATGDDGIEVAGLFLPRGFVGRTIIGSVAGNILGDAVGGNVAGAVGSGIGASAGMASAGSEADGIRFVVAVSPTKVHVLRPATVGGVHKHKYTLMHTFERENLEVSVKSRASIRKLILEDHTADVRIELEGSRAWFKHANDVFHALVIQDHTDDDDG
jgi:hypothetical protein